MIDIHSHFLPAVDDGSKNFSQTESMLKQAVESGITDLIATPHYNEFVSKEYTTKIEKEFKNIEEWINKINLNLSVHLASEILMDAKIVDWQKDKNIFHGRDKDYILFELPHFYEINEVSETIFKFKLNNITPILAHPERSLKLQQNPAEIVKWVEQGCVMQLNAGSITGQFGKTCQQVAKRFLDAGVIHLIASDAHEHKHRNYKVLNKAKEYIEENFDEEFSNILFISNPKNILKSQPIKFFKIESENLQINKFKVFMSKLGINTQ